jgi:enoyl-CoA hydratase
MADTGNAGTCTTRSLLLEVRGPIAVITVDRPKALNALDSATIGEFEAILDRLSADRTIRVVIVTGAGGKAFVAGADVAEMRDMSPAEARRFARRGQAAFARLERLPQPVIAAVNGFALGGGCELAMACDIRIAAENARFGLPETGLGITPGFGGTQRLPRLVGVGRAKRLMFTGDLVDAAEALRIGLVDAVVPVGGAPAAALAMAEKIAGRAPGAIAACKAAVRDGLDGDLDRGIAHEAEVFALCFADPEQRERMAAFVEKRP